MTYSINWPIIARSAVPFRKLLSSLSADRPHTPPADRMYATDVRQHHRLMPSGRGHNNILIVTHAKLLQT